MTQITTRTATASSDLYERVGWKRRLLRIRQLQSAVGLVYATTCILGEDVLQSAAGDREQFLPKTEHQHPYSAIVSVVRDACVHQDTRSAKSRSAVTCSAKLKSRLNGGHDHTLPASATVDSNRKPTSAKRPQNIRASSRTYISLTSVYLAQHMRMWRIDASALVLWPMDSGVHYEVPRCKTA